MSLIRQVLFSGLIATTMVILSGCGALDAEVSHHSLNAESRMSDSIFIDPNNIDNHSVYISVRNATTEHLNGLTEAIKQKFASSGWKIASSTKHAGNILQVMVIQAGQAQDPDSVWKSMQTGYGMALAGGLAGVATDSLTHNTAAAVGVGSAAAIGAWVADKLVQDVTYSLIIDVQIAVHTNGNVNQGTSSSFLQGNSSREYQSYSRNTHWQKFRTRVASVADKVNLNFAEARPVLVKQLSSELAGIFVDQD